MPGTEKARVAGVVQDEERPNLVSGRTLLFSKFEPFSF